MIPAVATVRRDDTHRLIPARYGDASVLAPLADSEGELGQLFELEGATNERLHAEANLLPGIGVHELLFGVPYARIVNAAFVHAQPAGSRFNGPDRGAWYAAFELETSAAEVAFHKGQELREIGWREPETFSFTDFTADFRTELHDLRGDAAWAGYLDPDSYVESQRLARELLASGSAGIVYPCVRRDGGTCLACFRPALVTNVRQGRNVTVAFRDAFSPPRYDCGRGASGARIQPGPMHERRVALAPRRAAGGPKGRPHLRLPVRAPVSRRRPCPRVGTAPGYPFGQRPCGA